jgi:hypothetical protein
VFRCNDDVSLRLGFENLRFLNYYCSNCHGQYKKIAILIEPDAQTSGLGTVYKYGEKPSFGIPVPNKLLRLFGKDSKIFLKRRQCENQGLGIGAFAYYRRVVESHKNDLYDEIIRVCQTIGTSADLVEQLRAAKGENSFEKAIGDIKAALPQGLLINGHNPLTALHRALSVGLHDKSDEECLESARAVRVVLGNLVEKISILRQDNKDLHDSVQHLLGLRGGS